VASAADQPRSLVDCTLAVVPVLFFAGSALPVDGWPLAVGLDGAGGVTAGTVEVLRGLAGGVAPAPVMVSNSSSSAW
jgi:hypothetical protein